MKPLVFSVAVSFFTALPPAWRAPAPPHAPPSPLATLSRLYAERYESLRLWDLYSPPLRAGACYAGRDRAMCRALLLRFEEASVVRERAGREYHMALRALFLEGGERRLSAGDRGALMALLARWMQSNAQDELRRRRLPIRWVCIDPLGDEADRIWIRLTNRRSVGDSHRAAGDALLRMRYGPRFAPMVRPEPAIHPAGY